MTGGKTVNRTSEKKSDKKQKVAKGSDHAAITIIEYSDFGCKSCTKVQRVLDEVLKAYPDEIRLLFKHYPSIVNPDSILAHEAALAAAEQGRFWEMHERLLSTEGKLTQEVLLDYAMQLMLDTKRFSKALNHHSYKEAILNGMMEAKGFGVTTAPTFFINGQRLVGARPVGDFISLIENQLRSARPQSLNQAVEVR